MERRNGGLGTPEVKSSWRWRVCCLLQEDQIHVGGKRFRCTLTTAMVIVPFPLPYCAASAVAATAREILLIEVKPHDHMATFCVRDVCHRAVS